MAQDNLPYKETLTCDLIFSEQKGLYGTTLGDIMEEQIEKFGHDFIIAKKILAKWYGAEIEAFAKTYASEVLEPHQEIEIGEAEMDSPRFYNFSTDQIVLKTSNIEILHKAIASNGDGDRFKETLVEATTRTDSYAPYYSMADFNQPISEWDATQQSMVIDFISGLADDADEINLDEEKYEFYGREVGVL